MFTLVRDLYYDILSREDIAVLRCWLQFKPDL